MRGLQNRLEFVFGLWELFCRGKVFRQGSLKVVSLPYEIMNKGCPLLYVVPRRLLLGIEHAVRSRTSYEYLKVRARRFEAKPIVMSPWIEHRVRIEVFHLHYLA